VLFALLIDVGKRDPASRLLPGIYAWLLSGNIRSSSTGDDGSPLECSSLTAP